MTEVDAEPQHRLVALPVSLDVTAVADSAADLIEFGRLYWDLLGVDQDTGEVVWRHPISTLCQGQGVSIRRSHVIAAAGVRARMADLSCPECGEPMTLRARDDLERYVDAGTLIRCVDCDTSLQRAVAVEERSGAAQYRGERRRRARHDLAVRQARVAWEQAQRAHVAAGHHPSPEPRRDATEPDSTLPAELVTLALLRHRPDRPVVAPVNTWDLPLAPTASMIELLLAECLDLGLLQINRSESPRICRWRRTFADALVSADGDPSRVGEPECDGYQLGWAAWCIPGTADDAAAHRQLDAILTERFALDQLTAADRAQLLDLAIELIAAETVHAFELGLRDVNLPGVPKRHRARLEAAALSLARLRDLDECLNHADAAVYHAVKAAEANPEARQINMTVHGVNRLADSAQGLYLVPSFDRIGYRRTGRNNLSALTWVLFHGVLGVAPLTASRTLAASTLAAGHDEADPSPELDTWLATVFDIDLQTDPQAVYRALEQHIDHQNPVIGQAAESLIELVDRLRTTTGDLRGALAAAVAATDLLRTRVLPPGRTAQTLRVGEYLADVMVQAARNPPGCADSDLTVVPVEQP